MRQLRTGRLVDGILALRRDRRGSVAMAAAAGVAMITGVAALAIDASVVYAERNHLQTVADLAALGAAQELPDSAAAMARARVLIERGLECTKRQRGGPAPPAAANGYENYAKRRPLPERHDCGEYSASIGPGSVGVGHWHDASGSIRPDNESPSAIQVLLRRSASLDNAVPTIFGRLFGVDVMDVSARAVATKVGGGGMELALVLDVSASMQGPKIQRLRDVSITLVDSTYAGKETPRNLWVSVVPFAGRVNIARYGRSWMAESPPISSRLCTGLRSGNRENDDTPPSVEPFPSFHDFTCPGEPMLALTRERSLVRAELQALGTTIGASTQIGTAWGWRALSPRWRGLWSGTDPAVPHDYGTPDIRKVAVIMTDGMNRPDVSNDPFTTAEADARLAAQCTTMKQVGIIIYTITFDAPASIDPLYRECASSPDQLYRASSADQLAAAFETIGNSLIGRLRLIR